MRNKKLTILLIIIALSFILFSSIDKKLRYQLGLEEYNKYNPPLTRREEDYIKEKDFLIGVYDYPPLVYTNEFNNYNTGIIMDYLFQLAIELSTDIHIKVEDPKSLGESLNQGEMDIIIEENYKDEVSSNNLSQPLITVKSRILVKNNSQISTLDDLTGEYLVVLRKDHLNERIFNHIKDIPNLNIIEVENIYEAFALLNKNVVSGIIAEDIEISHFLNVTNRGANYNFLEPILYEKEIGLKVDTENKELLTILNKGILQLKKKNLINQTLYKWLGSNYDDGSVDINTIEIVYKFFIGMAILSALFIAWNYIMRQKVNEKTRELSESKEELKLIVEAMNDGLIVIEDDSTIIESNDSLAKIIGLSKSKVIGADYRDLDELKPFLDKRNINKICNIKDSYYYITCQKITDNKRMIVIEDYTDKYLKEQTERQESKMIAIGQLSAGLAHEIRNPLGLIKSYSYILDNKKLGGIYEQAISVINDSVDRINNLIENLLRFSKFSNEKSELINIRDFIKNIIQVEITDLDPSIKIDIKFLNIEREDILINTEVLRIVLINLISNSIESFNNIDRTIKKVQLNVEVTKSQLKITVSDNGSGIKREKLEKIFDPFFSTKENGTGLGLYIVSTEISNNKGDIKVSSEIGKGTTFDVILPIWSDYSE